MSILEIIKKQKIREVAFRKLRFPLSELEKLEFFDSEPYSLKQNLLDPSQSGIIAEFKRKSPSKGDINKEARPEIITPGYIAAGASALSVLTDEGFFGAKNDDFLKARKLNRCPILRKDFIIDEYQIIESKAMGADVILLIAKMLTSKEIFQYSKLAKSLKMEVLLETQNLKEIDSNKEIEVDFFGINNRNLNTFETNVENSIKLAANLPAHILKIAESGIENAETILQLKNNGFNGFLIGEYFMRSEKPEAKCRELISQLK